MQLPDVISKYPNLKIVIDGQGTTFLKGVLDISNDIGEVVGHFLIEIRCSHLFPFKFPILFETGGDIPFEANWHRNADNSCCITVWPEELKICRYGIMLLDYIEKYAIPYLANQIFRKQTGKYKNGEFAHNKPGIIQYYASICR